MSAPSDEQLRAEVHRLASELSQRKVSEQLGISRYRVSQLLAEPVADQPGQVADAGRTVADHGAAGGQVADQVADDPADQSGQSRQVADCGGVFVPFREGLGTDLADLMRTGCTAAEAVDYAVATLAAAYRGALELGVLSDGDPLDVLAVTFRPPARAATAA